MNLKLILFTASFLALVNPDAIFTEIEKCASSNQTLVFQHCELSDGRFNVVFEFLKPVQKIHLFASFYRLVDGNYVQIFRAPEFEWCSVVGTKKRPNQLIKIFLDPVRKRFPVIFKCPIVGVVDIHNVAPDYKMMMMFPEGTYRIVFKAYNSEDANVALVSVVLKIDG